MATCEGCCHLTGAMLNLATEAADRARIGMNSVFGLDPNAGIKDKKKMSASPPTVCRVTMHEAFN
jgi:hypothetical protein